MNKKLTELRTALIKKIRFNADDENKNGDDQIFLVKIFASFNHATFARRPQPTKQSQTSTMGLLRPAGLAMTNFLRAELLKNLDAFKDTEGGLELIILRLFLFKFLFFGGQRLVFVLLFILDFDFIENFINVF